jgi:hypothetical protein
MVGNWEGPHKWISLGPLFIEIAIGDVIVVIRSMLAKKKEILRPSIKLRVYS